ncbi:hypothetical protein N665_8341s0001 [Sinapis alba]|nr:hypothetical protein N665_8341s0001 [Sinapis alba]
MKSLEELGFSHEPSEWACPAFAQDVHPLHIYLRQLYARQLRRLVLLLPPSWLVHDKIHELSTVRSDQPGANEYSATARFRRERNGGDGEIGGWRFGEGMREERSFVEDGGHGRH